MCIPTERELECLAGLQKSWQRLYWREFVRVLAEDALSATLATRRAPRLTQGRLVSLRDWTVTSSKPH
jgi:hypothetical protein